MKKDAYYFPHFCNARHDRKLKRVQKELGVEGYGIYFMLLEVLREQQDFKYPLGDIDLLADEFGTSEQKITAIVANYKLFDIDQNFFTSHKLQLYLQPYLERSKKAQNAAIERWSRVKKIEEKAEGSQVYIIECHGHGERFVKIGQTSTTVRRRFGGKMPYEFNIVAQLFSDECTEIEYEYANKFAEFSYLPKIEFGGRMECYSIDILDNILNFIPKSNTSQMLKHKDGNTAVMQVKETKVKETKVLIEFEQFWEMYSYKKNKTGCLKKWKKLKQDEKDCIFKSLYLYIESTPDKQYRKYPLSYLNGKCWEDEIVKPMNEAERRLVDNINNTRGFLDG